MKLHAQKFALASGLTSLILTIVLWISVFATLFLLKYISQDVIQLKEIADRLQGLNVGLLLSATEIVSWFKALLMAFVMWYAIGFLFSTIYNRLLER